MISELSMKNGLPPIMVCTYNIHLRQTLVSSKMDLNKNEEQYCFQPLSNGLGNENAEGAHG